LDELRRIIREEEPPRPSTRLSTCDQSLDTIADRRRVDPRGLASTVRGDLDWIVMKSLDKDRSRRYDSVASLAEDIRRYLDGKPIHARPPSNFYRLQKYSRRHRVAFLTVTLVGITMILGTAASLWQMSEAIDERNAKDAALREATGAKAEAIAAKQQVEQFAEDLVRANELVVSGKAHADTGRWAEASRDYDAAVAIQPGYYLPRFQRAQLLTRMGLWPEAANDYANAIDTGASTSGPQWWGVPALFLYTGYDDAFRHISEQHWDEILREPSKPQWMLLRDLVASDEPIASIDHKVLVEIAVQWLSESVFPREPRPPHLGPNSRPPGDGPPERSPGPRRHDQFSRVVQLDSTPLCIRQYITAIVHLRAKECDKAIELLSQAERDPRWPGKYLIHAPMALAHYHKGDIVRASESLDRSDASIQELLSAPMSDRCKVQSHPGLIWSRVCKSTANRCKSSAVQPRQKLLRPSGPVMLCPSPKMLKALP